MSWKFFVGILFLVIACLILSYVFMNVLAPGRGEEGIVFLTMGLPLLICSLQIAALSHEGKWQRLLCILLFGIVPGWLMVRGWDFIEDGWEPKAVWKFIVGILSLLFGIEAIIFPTTLWGFLFVVGIWMPLNGMSGWAAGTLFFIIIVSIAIISTIAAKIIRENKMGRVFFLILTGYIPGVLIFNAWDTIETGRQELKLS